MKFITKYLPDFLEEITELFYQQRKINPLPIWLFLALCFNLVIAPAIYAATGEDLTPKASYALGILTLVTVALSLYLFVVIFQPERF